SVALSDPPSFPTRRSSDLDLCRDQVRELYFAIMAEQQQASPEEHPEFDAVGIWRHVIGGHQTAFTRALPAAKLEQMPLFLAEMRSEERRVGKRWCTRGSV